VGRRKRLLHAQWAAHQQIIAGWREKREKRERPEALGRWHCIPGSFQNTGVLLTAGADKPSSPLSVQ